MLISKKVQSLPDGSEIWAYQREMEYLVREIDSYTDGRKSYLVKSPCKKLYEFQMTDLTPEQLFTLIEEEKA